jgi:hypothetical protein
MLVNGKYVRQGTYTNFKKEESARQTSKDIRFAAFVILAAAATYMVVTVANSLPL